MPQEQQRHQLYVGNLSFKATETDLVRAFTAYGPCTAKVITDRASGRSRGFGFVEYDDRACAEAAIEALNGADLLGRPLTVKFADPRPERRPRYRED